MQSNSFPFSHNINFLGQLHEWSIIHSRSPVGCRCEVELIIIIYGFISISPFAQIVIDLRSKISSKCSHTHTQERRTHSHNRNTIRRRFTLASHRQKTIAVLMNPVAYLEGNLSIWHTHTLITHSQSDVMFVSQRVMTTTTSKCPAVTWPRATEPNCKSLHTRALSFTLETCNCVGIDFDTEVKTMWCAMCA